VAQIAAGLLEKISQGRVGSRTTPERLSLLGKDGGEPMPQEPWDTRA
jgi:hypothetical protein